MTRFIKKKPPLDAGYQIRHIEFGLYQVSCMGMGFWYPMSGMPEQGVCCFPMLADAENYIKFLCTDADQPLSYCDLSIEPFNKSFSLHLERIGAEAHPDWFSTRKN